MKKIEDKVILGIIFIILFGIIFFINEPIIKEYCGNGVCESEEVGKCSEDCDWCGDGYCQIDEDCETCSEDCGCGFLYLLNDKICEIKKGENCRNSAEDCKCENEICELDGECRSYCGNGFCEKGEDKICKLDCDWCGDGVCDETENCLECSKDCGNCDEKYCGDGVCDEGECENFCLKDCSFLECGNQICEIEKGENCRNSPIDCKCEEGYCDTLTGLCIYRSCGNVICEDDEDFFNCPNDCPYNYVPEDLSDLNYPIIFVHGHSTIEQEPEYSITMFDEFQERLQEDNYYYDKGIILPSTDKTKLGKGVWANLEKPISVRTTYYANAYDEYGSYVGPEDNREIRIYAERLGDVVEKVLYFTSKNKVIIIAHSMGGLVSREYIENLGGEEYVDKLILIGTPNKGVEGYIGSFCDWVHPGPECVEMSPQSDFLKGLNISENVNYLSMVGVANNPYLGCLNNQGDDVVCSSSAELEGAENFYVGKSVSGTMHVQMGYPSAYLNIYEKILNFLD